MILIRTREIDDRLKEFATQLHAYSGLEIAFVLDGRRADTSNARQPKIILTKSACEAHGLYCPDDFAWRCGDYGMYLARAQFPAVDYFWQIEDDVRIGGREPSDFFRVLATSAHDLLATYTEIASPGWAWSHTVEGKGLTPWKCFFPVIRLSAAALDQLLVKRRAHSAQWSRRHCWTNDEGFVATTIAASPLTFGDLNDFSAPLYSTQNFSFETVRDGSLPLPTDGPPEIFHPVLYGTALRDKLERLSERKAAPTLTKRLIAKADAVVGPTAVARWRNRRIDW